MNYPVIRSEKEIIALLRKNIPPCAKQYLGFFNSHLNSFITDPIFMSIALEDKMIHRGYAVFETTKVFGNKIYQLDKHIDRFMDGIKRVDLPSNYTADEYKNILLKLASLARKQDPKSDFELRFFYTGGLGSLLVNVDENLLSFYAIAYKVDFSIRPVEGVQEYIVPCDQIYKEVAKSKNTNYLTNTIITMQSKKKGGYLGIKVDNEGNMLESPISNIAFILKDGRFSVPPFERTLRGTTVLRLLEYAEKRLIPEGHIKEIHRGYVKYEEVFDVAKEVMFVGGDFVIPILKIDGKTVTDTPGEITLMFQKFLKEDKESNEVVDEIPKYIESDFI